MIKINFIKRTLPFWIVYIIFLSFLTYPIDLDETPFRKLIYASYQKDKVFNIEKGSNLYNSEFIPKLPSPPNSSQPNYGNTLNISCLGSLENLDPHKLFFRTDRDITSIFYEGLVQFSHKNPDSIIACLAEKWETSEDGRNYRFYLRKNVYYHSDPCFPKSRHLNADDVIFSFKRIAKLDNKISNILADEILGFKEFQNAHKNYISGIRKIDEFTLEIKLIKPYINFLKILAIPNLSIIPSEAVDYYGNNFKTHPVGTGPFRLVKWNKLKSLELVRNANYWRTDERGNPLPYLDNINIHLISNNLVIKSKFINGSLDLVVFDELIFNEFQNHSEFTSKARVLKKSSYPSGIRFWGFSLNKNNPLSRNVSLRRAILSNFDFSQLKTFQIDSTKVGSSPINYYTRNNQKITFSKKVDYNKTDFEKFKNYQITISTNIMSRDLKVLAKSISELGLNYSLDFRQIGYYKNIFKAHPDIFRVSYSLSYPDIEEYYSLFYSKNIGKSNLVAFSNKQYDKLYEQALIESEKTKRYNLFIAMEKILQREVPVICFCSWLDKYYLANKNIKGLKIRFETPDFSEVWIENNNEK